MDAGSKKVSEDKLSLINDFFGIKKQSPEQSAKEAISSLKSSDSFFPSNWSGRSVAWFPETCTYGLFYYATYSLGAALTTPILGPYSYLGGALLAGGTRVVTNKLHHKWVVAPKIEKIEKFQTHLTQQNANKTSFTKDEFDAFGKLPGLENIKDQLISMADKVIVDQLRVSIGLPVHNNCYHMIFEGNSGTGKTMAAKGLATVLFKMGVIRENKCILADKSSFYSGIIGKSGERAESVVNEASGGVLFIDEAYSLNKREINLNGEQVGSDIIEKLLLLLEERKDDVVVIFAGYPDAMKKFRSSNPGLASRVPNIINFEDYNSKQLVEIFDHMCSEKGYTLSDKVRSSAQKMFTQIKEKQGKSFANARTVRNFFEKAVLAQAERLAKDLPTSSGAGLSTNNGNVVKTVPGKKRGANSTEHPLQTGKIVKISSQTEVLPAKNEDVLLINLRELCESDLQTAFDRLTQGLMQDAQPSVPSRSFSSSGQLAGLRGTIAENPHLALATKSTPLD